MKLSALLIGVWVCAVFALFFFSGTLSAVILAADILATFLIARRIWTIRGNLVFSNQYYRDYLIPPSQRIGNLNAILNGLILLAAFIPSSALLIMQQPSIDDTSRRIAVALWMLLGHIGLLGIATAVVAKVRGD